MVCAFGLCEKLEQHSILTLAIKGLLRNTTMRKLHGLRNSAIKVSLQRSPYFASWLLNVAARPVFRLLVQVLRLRQDMVRSQSRSGGVLIV